MPSAVRRLRSHEPQKGVVVEAMIPKRYPLGSSKRSAGSEPRSLSVRIDP